MRNRAPTTSAGAKTPVTIITGFLGAGKTTLLNYVLRHRDAKNISVIENEFGEVNIDNELVADNLIEKEDLVSLDNGCVCCSLRKDIVKALAEIERRSRHRNKRVDHVILETTGLADPAPVAFTFFANPWIASRFRLDSIICVVDTRYVMQHLVTDRSEGINETAQQLAFSDLILLNKTDLVTAQQLEDIKVNVRRINTTARLQECRLAEEGGCPPLSDLLETHSFSVDRALQVDPHFMDSDSGSDGEGSMDSDSSSEEDESSAQQQQQQQQRHGSACQQHTPPQQQQQQTARHNNTASSAAPGAPEGHPQQQQQQHRQQGRMSAAASSTTSLGEDPAAAAAAADEARRQSGAAAGTSAAAVAEGSPAAEAAPRKRGAEQVEAGEECHQCPHAGDRQPKRRRKQMHDLCGVASVGIVARGPLDEYRFNMFMRDLLAEKSKDIFRCKGVLAVHGYGNRKFVFQGVHETICYGPSDRPWADDEPRINQIVFIGRNLDRKALMNGFRTCVWSPLPDGWKEAHDPITGQPYYYNPTTHQKTWARPVEAKPAPNAVTVTRLTSTEQPRALLPSGTRRKSSGLSAEAAKAAAAYAAAIGAGRVGGVYGSSPHGQQAGGPGSINTRDSSGTAPAPPTPVVTGEEAAPMPAASAGFEVMGQLHGEEVEGAAAQS